MKSSVEFSFLNFLKTSVFASSCMGNPSFIREQETSFSGDWKLDNDKRTFGKILSEHSMPIEMKICQTKDSNYLEPISKNRSGEINAYSESFPLWGAGSSHTETD